MMPLPEDGTLPSWPPLRDDHRQAAVLFLLYPDDHFESTDSDPLDLLHLVFILRPDYDGTHGGQISLPGGRQENDEPLIQTATRETHEEVGVNPAQIEILGRLPAFHVYASNHNVFPYVGFTPRRPRFVPCEVEVAEIIEAPLKALMDPDNQRSEQRELTRWGKTRVPYFAIDHHKVWGATAIMLAEFLALIRAAQ